MRFVRARPTHPEPAVARPRITVGSRLPNWPPDKFAQGGRVAYVDRAVTAMDEALGLQIPERGVHRTATEARQRREIRLRCADGALVLGRIFHQVQQGRSDARDRIMTTDGVDDVDGLPEIAREKQREIAPHDRIVGRHA